jgi:hypothetical protein
VECGGLVDYEGAHKRTALDLAAIHGTLDALSALVTCGATLDYVNADGKTALMLAVEVSGRLCHCQALVTIVRAACVAACVIRQCIEQGPKGTSNDAKSCEFLTIRVWHGATETEP